MNPCLREPKINLFNLVIECDKDDFTCSDGSCIESFRRCDFIEDCSDGSDENNCRKLNYIKILFFSGNKN